MTATVGNGAEHVRCSRDVEHLHAGRKDEHDAHGGVAGVLGRRCHGVLSDAAVSSRVAMRANRPARTKSMRSMMALGALDDGI
ncbi:hypothetical protein [Microbacterium sp.]|uniref:hypothetical protein n=1 Tax=Microbacterium sp. TaxID=51671 RepID=UPI003C7598A3